MMAARRTTSDTIAHHTTSDPREEPGALAAHAGIFCRSARKHGCHTFRIDVEGQEYQRLVAWVSPLVHEGVRFIDQGTRSPCFCLTVDRVGPGAGDDKV